MAGKMVEHFTGEQLFKDWCEVVASGLELERRGMGAWSEASDQVRDKWEAYAVRLNTKIHAGTTPSIDPAAYLKARGVTVDADAQDTYTDADQGGPGFTTLTLGPDGVSLT